MTPTPTIPTDLITAPEAAALLACSAETVRRKVRAGTLPGYDLLIGVRLSREELACWLQGRHTSQRITRSKLQQGLRCLGERI